ncbi:polysaccharide deacetylase family protein [Humibacillus xanthopallidus]|uniref:polysaccharide deacetylase family protein n=1 Tax=Humibacillus xanthopallidus TaxID=412689 RepID=UPI001FE8A36B|nr:polysaccharide deacetylase family protein [Humibacillus xanthopallidus]
MGRARVGCIGAAGVVIALMLAACQGAEPQATPSLTSATGSVTSSTPIPTSTVPATTRATTPTAGPGSTSGTTTRPLVTPSGTRPATTTSTRPATSPTSSPRVTPSTPTTAPTTCSIPSRLLGRDLTTLGTTRKVVALTFDGGGDNQGVASILRTLATQGVPGSFFLTGEFVDDFPASARAIAASHPVGNHSYHHPDLTTMSSAAVRTEVRSAAARIKAVTGQDPRPWFRFPLGAVDARTIGIVNGECYVPFRWTVDTLGWKGTSGGQSVSSVVGRVVSALVPGQIVLMHVGAHPTDHSTLDADALPRVIAELRARGYSFVTLGAVIGPAP